MTNFQWEGLSMRGERLSGTLRAGSRESVVKQLRSRGVLPLPATIVECDSPKRTWRTRTSGRRVRPRDVALLARQLAAMLDAGLPLVEVLNILAQRSAQPALRDVVADVKAQVESGMPLAQALGRHPQAFGDLFVSMVGVGEMAGSLDRVLLRLAENIEKTAQLKEKVARALIYPGTVIAVAGCVTAALLLYVIPMFAELFAGFGQQLPLPTRIVVGMSEIARRSAIYLVVSTVLATAGTARYYATAAGRIRLDGWALRVPLIGTLIAQSAVVRVTRSLATLLSAGIAVLEALAIAGSTAGNRIVERAVDAARAAVRDGRPLAEELQISAIFPPLVCQMIAVGERTGSLDVMLERAAALCDEEVDRLVSTLMALLEPAIMVCLGVLMGGLVISMYLPVFQLGNVL
jgi:type IV pilus assembly protein PilC